MNHSPEPWYYNEKGQCILDAGGRVILSTLDGTKEACDDMRYIVSCINTLFQWTYGKKFSDTTDYEAGQLN